MVFPVFRFANASISRSPHIGTTQTKHRFLNLNLNSLLFEKFLLLSTLYTFFPSKDSEKKKKKKSKGLLFEKFLLLFFPSKYSEKKNKTKGNTLKYMRLNRVLWSFRYFVVFPVIRVFLVNTGTRFQLYKIISNVIKYHSVYYLP